MPGEEKPGFVTRMFTSLMRHGTAGLSEEEFEELRANLRTILEEAEPGAKDEAGAVPAPGGG